MNTKEKIDRAADTTTICLHKEGIFYKLYNRHAMLFTENIKPLKIKAVFVKSVGECVYSCGFPASILKEIERLLAEHGGVVEETEKLITVTNMDWDEGYEYGRWCDKHKPEPISRALSGDSGLTDIEREIAGFQVMRRTPLEAMQFIVHLQEELYAREG